MGQTLDSELDPPRDSECHETPISQDSTSLHVGHQKKPNFPIRP
jgi:hypothetical protein